MTKERLPLSKNVPQYGYYGAVINDAFINGAKGEPSLDFDQLDSSEQAVWDSLAQTEGYKRRKAASIFSSLRAYTYNSFFAQAI